MKRAKRLIASVLVFLLAFLDVFTVFAQTGATDPSIHEYSLVINGVEYTNEDFAGLEATGSTITKKGKSEEYCGYWLKDMLETAGAEEGEKAYLFTANDNYALYTKFTPEQSQYGSTLFYYDEEYSNINLILSPEATGKQNPYGLAAIYTDIDALVNVKIDEQNYEFSTAASDAPYYAITAGNGKNYLGFRLDQMFAAKELEIPETLYIYCNDGFYNKVIFTKEEIESGNVFLANVCNGEKAEDGTFWVFDCTATFGKSYVREVQGLYTSIYGDMSLVLDGVERELSWESIRLYNIQGANGGKYRGFLMKDVLNAFEIETPEKLFVLCYDGLYPKTEFTQADIEDGKVFVALYKNGEAAESGKPWVGLSTGSQGFYYPSGVEGVYTGNISETVNVNINGTDRAFKTLVGKDETAPRYYQFKGANGRYYLGFNAYDLLQTVVGEDGIPEKLIVICADGLYGKEWFTKEQLEAGQIIVADVRDGEKDEEGLLYMGNTAESMGRFYPSGVRSIYTDSSSFTYADSITLNQAEGTISKAGGTLTLTAEIAPEAYSFGAANWSSSKKEVATVRDGVVTAAGEGVTVIKATVYGASFNPIEAVCTVTVKYGEEPEPTPEYTVSFETNGGTEVPAQTVKAGEKAVKPASPRRGGYSFKGWFADEEFKTSYTFDEAVTEDITVYAKWVRENSVISSGGSSSSSSAAAVKKAVVKEAVTPVAVRADGCQSFGSALISRPAAQYTAAEQAAVIVNGTWKQDTYGYWYLYDASGNAVKGWALVSDRLSQNSLGNASWYYFGADGKLLTGWQWVAGQDGKLRCYYLNEEAGSLYGACVTEGTTPDNWQVNAAGAWTENGEVKTK